MASRRLFDFASSETGTLPIVAAVVGGVTGIGAAVLPQLTFAQPTASGTGNVSAVTGVIGVGAAVLPQLTFTQPTASGSGNTGAPQPPPDVVPGGALTLTLGLRI